MPVTTSGNQVAEAPPQKVWFESGNPDNLAVLPGNQRPEARLRIKFQLYSFRADNQPTTTKEKFLLVSLDGSEITPGTLGVNRPDKRGYYTESVQVKMWFPDSNGLVIRQDLPQTTEQGGSMSNSLSFNVGIGFFGETPTGSFGMGISNGISQSLPDFAFYNESNNTVLLHRAELRLVTGNKYFRPPDLVDPTAWATHNLCELPARAVANMPLVSQALFHAPGGLTATRMLQIEVVHRLMQVEKTVQPGDLVIRSTPVAYDPNKRDQAQHVHGSGLALDIDPYVVTHNWQFSVPFAAV